MKAFKSSRAARSHSPGSSLRLRRTSQDLEGMEDAVLDGLRDRACENAPPPPSPPGGVGGGGRDASADSRRSAPCRIPSPIAEGGDACDDDGEVANSAPPGLWSVLSPAQARASMDGLDDEAGASLRAVDRSHPSSPPGDDDAPSFTLSHGEVAKMKRRATRETDVHSTVAASSTRASTQGTSATRQSSSVWNKLLPGGAEGRASLWDELNGSAYGGVEGDNHDDISPLSACCRGTWYEIRHFLSTALSHPEIWMSALAVGLLAGGLGAWAVTNERDAFAREKMRTAEFVARETAGYFASEFKKAFVPLYSVREAVLHSGTFDDLPGKIGRFPNRLKGEDVEVPGGLANVRDVEGVCDDPEVMEKWDDLVGRINRENDLNGLAVRYRLMPKNVDCLEYKANKGMLGSGMDMSNSPHPFWSMVVTDLFLKRWKGLHTFGPFETPDGKELFCTHLAIWNKPLETTGDLELGALAQQTMTNVQGTEVSDVWGFVMNYLNWGEMKKRSNIERRFADVGMEFRLERREEDVDPDLAGPKGDATRHYQLLVESERADLLDDSNSIVVETESLHGVWLNRVGIASSHGWNPHWWGAAVASVSAAAVLLALLTAAVLVKSRLHRDLVRRLLPRKAILKLQRGQTVAERHHLVTVFYADVVADDGGKGVRPSDGPEVVLSTLNDLYNDLDVLAKKHGVYKVETVGSRYVAVAGAPDRELSATASARKIALFALDAMSHVDRQFRAKTGRRLRLRAGVASGPCVAGVVGREVPRYCLFGDVVDLASALERTSEGMGIQCSETTSRLLRDNRDVRFVLEPRDDGARSSSWLERAAPCEDCFGLKRGSFVLNPCGHVLCAKCNAGHKFDVCPTCRSKVDHRSEWTSDGPRDVGTGGSTDEGEEDACSVEWAADAA
ncbi:hypothetical protein ACHAWF_010850 [Thalassiosira exigua]